MRWAQLDRLRHLAKRQLVVDPGVYELFDPAQASGTEPASERLHRMTLYCITLDQRDGKGLLDGIQKQPAIRKARNSLGIHCRGQGTDSCVNQASHSAQFHVAP